MVKIEDGVATISGKYETWKYSSERRYANVTLTCEQLDQLATTYLFKAKGGAGEQRSSRPAHVKKLRKAMREGTFTPTSLSLGLRDSHKKVLQAEDGKFTLTFPLRDGKKENRLALTDGGHRKAMVEEELEAVGLALDKCDDEDERSELEQQRADLLNLPFPCVLHLDGETDHDFVNLQAGLAVDRSHLLSMGIRHKDVKDEKVQGAYRLARALNEQKNGPLFGIIQMDSDKSPLSVPLSSLVTKSSSSLSFSLAGLYQMGVDYGRTTEELAELVRSVDTTLREACPEALEPGHFLRPYKDGGNKGQVSLLIGISTLMAFRQGGKPSLTAEDWEALVDSIGHADMSGEVNGDFGDPRKRQLLGDLAALLFDKFDCDKEGDLPTGLVNSLSLSAYGVKAK